MHTRIINHTEDRAKGTREGDALGRRALHPSEQGLLGVALELVHHLPLHGGASGFRAGDAFHRRVAVREGLQGRQVTG